LKVSFCISLLHLDMNELVFRERTQLIDQLVFHRWYVHPDCRLRLILFCRGWLLWLISPHKRLLQVPLRRPHSIAPLDPRLLMLRALAPCVLCCPHTPPCHPTYHLYRFAFLVLSLSSIVKIRHSLRLLLRISPYIVPRDYRLLPIRRILIARNSGYCDAEYTVQDV